MTAEPAGGRDAMGQAAVPPVELDPVVHRRSLLHNVASLLGGQATTWLITTIVMVIVPRRVGPNDMGSYRIATSVWAVGAMVMAFGTTTLVTVEVARRHQERTVHLGPILVTRVLGFLLVVPALAVFASVVGYSDDILVLLAIAAVGTLLASLGEVAAAALTGLERLGPVAGADVLNKLTAAVLMVVAVFATRDIRLVAAAGVLSACLSVGFLYRSLRRLKRIDFSVPRGAVRSALRRGSPYFVIGVTLVAYNQIDVVVMSLLVSDVEIGWYGAADTLFGTLLFIPTIVMSSLLPKMVRTNADDPNAAASMLSQAFVTLSLFSVPIGLGTFVIARPAATLLYGEAFDGTGPVLAVFGIVLMLTFQTVLLGQHAIATGRQRMWNVLLAVAIPITVVYDLVMVPVMHRHFDNGAIAGASGYIITESLMVVVGIWKLAPNLASRVVGRRAVKVLLAGAAMVAVTWPLRNVFILVPIVVGAIVYVAVLLVQRPFEPHERALYQRIAGRLPVLRRLG